jgi:hypothetical protein
MLPCDTEAGCAKLNTRLKDFSAEERALQAARKKHVCHDMAQRLAPEVLELAECPAEAFATAFKALLHERGDAADAS